ncbi:hypothetical protein [Parerythrobacter lacustris]|uniref:Uncharacterized protein n=1 Tax=Parerythrobacter lacustris TaxID=2969984 RepID=A0ABT1XRS5_9SPHN|nr:hypothetical protein [Parerythrobacter lacustris]
MNINWPIVLLLFAIVMIVIERNRTVRGMRDGSNDERPADPGPADDRRAVRHDPETERELEALRERVKVLERITVDNREASSIADEIEKLRDK